VGNIFLSSDFNLNGNIQQLMQIPASNAGKVHNQHTDAQTNTMLLDEQATAADTDFNYKPLCHQQRR